VSPWLPVIISACVLLFGIAAQLAAFAYFTGRMKGGQDATNALVAGLISRMDTFDRGQLSNAQEKGDIGARLEHLERNTANLGAISDKVSRLDERFSSFERRDTDRHELYRTHFDALQRQIAGLAGLGPGSVIELTAPQRRGRARPPADES
jgi:hypothetical protein